VFYLPIATAPDQTIIIPLDGANYLFRFRWNMRAGWTVAMSDEAERPIFALTGLRLGVDLFSRVRSDPRVPAGSLMLVDLQRTGVEPGYTDLCGGPSEEDPRGRCMLVYFTADEVAELRATVQGLP
jgi:hypothetical protein